MMKLKEILHYMNTETTQSIDKNFYLHELYITTRRLISAILAFLANKSN